MACQPNCHNGIRQTAPKAACRQPNTLPPHRIMTISERNLRQATFTPLLGRHPSDDIEATIKEITRGRCAAISVPDEGTERLAVIIEVKKRGDSDEDARHELEIVNVKSPWRSQLARPRRRASRSGMSGLDPVHHQRHGQASGVCRAVPARSVRPFGRLGASLSEAY